MVDHWNSVIWMGWPCSYQIISWLYLAIKIWFTWPPRTTFFKMKRSLQGFVMLNLNHSIVQPAFFPSGRKLYLCKRPAGCCLVKSPPSQSHASARIIRKSKFVPDNIIEMYKLWSASPWITIYKIYTGWSSNCIIDASNLSFSCLWQPRFADNAISIRERHNFSWRKHF